jgi:hypothetical protein
MACSTSIKGENNAAILHLNEKMAWAEHQKAARLKTARETLSVFWEYR